MARKEIWSWIRTVAIAVILALLIRNYLLAFYIVDGSSMQPTLTDGQMVVVNKLAYRLGAVAHGDVVVFETGKAALNQTEERVLIKRIIALPGDTIAIIDGKVLLNDEELIEEYTDCLAAEDLAPLVIGAGQAFVLGDNRQPRGSWDSRDYGPIPLEAIVGKASFVIYPSPHRVR